MFLLENQVKEILQRYGIGVPKRVALIKCLAELNIDVNFPCMAKAQVRAGGRGKAGLIKRIESAEELNGFAEKTMELNSVEGILLEEIISISKELYCGIIIDTALGLPQVVVSTRGGMNIEEVLKENPEAIVRETVSPLEGLCRETAFEIWHRAGLEGDLLEQAGDFLVSLWKIFEEMDAVMLEVNPLAVSRESRLVALDGKMVADESSAFRHTELFPGGRTSHNFVPLNPQGKIGIIAGGAGLALASMDLVARLGGVPANFLDTGGGVSLEGMINALRQVTANQNVAGVLVNVFGGLNNCLTVVQGIINFLEEKEQAPVIVVKMRGFSQDEGWALLAEHGIDGVKFGTTEEAVRILLGKLKGDGTNVNIA